MCFAADAVLALIPTNMANLPDWAAISLPALPLARTAQREGTAGPQDL